MRSDGYEMFRSLSKESASFSDLTLPLQGVEVSMLRIAVKSALAGKSLSQLELRKRYGVTVVAIRRDSQMLSNPGGDTRIYANDVLFVLGPPEKIAGVASISHNPKVRSK